MDNNNPRKMISPCSRSLLQWERRQEVLYQWNAVKHIPDYMVSWSRRLESSSRLKVEIRLKFKNNYKPNNYFYWAATPCKLVKNLLKFLKDRSINFKIEQFTVLPWRCGLKLRTTHVCIIKRYRVPHPSSTLKNKEV